MELLAPQNKAKVLPYIQQWADSAAGMDGEAVFKAFSQFHETRVATVNACRALLDARDRQHPPFVSKRASQESCGDEADRVVGAAPKRRRCQTRLRHGHASGYL